MPELLTTHAPALAMLLVGLACHILARVVEARESGDGQTLAGWLSQRPYKTALAAGGALAAYGVLAETGQLSLLTAFGAGYLADSALEMVTARARRAVGGEA
ncbi:hypothetical protein SAMN05660831_02063 [Thiohalospira halophila DSM 15071]|uniref:Bacteriophage holin Hol, superfamily III n=1 Tax=Thiohalospira halophila DSM 15071 TaxID=1123397 RepID=A0A1I1UE01_9GAMM|nr:hypothetical protein [Thiohalospira halophila]SFD67003.1 hypothetical protein SAMN05660831_02063 [Thiohalospira halophila DSM 15071]